MKRFISTENKTNISRSLHMVQNHDILIASESKTIHNTSPKH